MKRFRAKLIHNGRTLFKRIRGTLDVRDRHDRARAAIPAWRGQFHLSPGRSLQAGGPYQLVLDDGSVGEVLVCRSATSINQETHADFVGCGLQPRDGLGLLDDGTSWESGTDEV
jgi:hypothetical protein